MDLTEYPNVQALRLVLELPFLDKKDKPALQAYLKLAESNGGAVNVHYEQIFYNGNPYGRYYPQLKSGGMAVRTAQAQWRHVRSALFSETEIDIDIVNCHPTILSNLCKINRINCPNLDSYVADRELFIRNNMCVTQEDVNRFNELTTSVWTVKDLAKAVVSATLYGCADYKKEFKLQNNPFNDTKFKLEIKRITQKLIALDKYSALVSDMRVANAKAHDGTFISFILQEEERKIVETAMNIFIENGFTVTSVIHDGFQVLSTNNSGIDSILQLINTEVAPLRFIRKPFADSALDIDIECKDSCLVCPETEYFCPQAFSTIIDRDANDLSTQAELECKQKYMDKFFAIIDQPSCIARRTPNGYDFLKIRTFKELYKCLFYSANNPLGPHNNFLDRWFSNPYSPRYVAMYWEPYTIHRPSGRPGLNTFTKFKHSVIEDFQVNEKLIEPHLYHIKEVLSDGNPEVNEFILNFCAKKVQEPNKKVGVSLVFKSIAEGAGKNTFTEFLSNNVLGEEFTRSFSDIDGLLKDFNADAERSVLTILDEVGANGASMKKHGRIKDFITRRSQNIERKGIDRNKTGDYNDYIWTSNEDWIIRVSESDRRCLCSEVSGKHVGDSKYFKNLLNHQNDTVGLHFFHYLLQRDISQFDTNNIPITDWKRSLKTRSYTPWIKTLIAMYNLPSENGVIKVHSKMLMEIFNGNCRDVEKITSTKSFNSSFVKYTLWNEPARIRCNGEQSQGFAIHEDVVLSTCRRILKDPGWTPASDGNGDDDDSCDPEN